MVATVQMWVNNSLENVNKQDVGEALIKSLDCLSDLLPFASALVPIWAQQNFQGFGIWAEELWEVWSEGSIV